MESRESTPGAVECGHTAHLYVAHSIACTDCDMDGAVLQPGLIGKANGSAYIETERSKIACAVFVPVCQFGMR